MDRAQELRKLMKNELCNKGDNAFSGKEKARLLKLMKSQKKNAENDSNSKMVGPTTTNAPIITSVQKPTKLIDCSTFKQPAVTDLPVNTSVATDMKYKVSMSSLLGYDENSEDKDEEAEEHVKQYSESRSCVSQAYPNRNPNLPANFFDEDVLQGRTESEKQSVLLPPLSELGMSEHTSLPPGFFYEEVCRIARKAI